MSSNFPLQRYPSHPEQAAYEVACGGRRTSRRCAEGSGQADEEGDYQADGCRSQVEATGRQADNRASRVAVK